MQNHYQLNPSQIQAKKMLVEQCYTFTEFKKDWKTLELGGKEEIFPYLGIAATLVAISPGGIAYLAGATGMDNRFLVLAGLTAIAGFTWMAGNSLYGTFKNRNRAKTVHAWKNFKSSIPPACAKDDLLIGYTTDKMLPFRIPKNELMAHGYILGQSGVGKTILGKSMMYQQILRGGGLIFVDGKLDSNAYNELYAMVVLSGRRDDFLIINPGDPSQSNTYNPVLFGDADEITARIMTLITAADSGAAFYRSQGTQAITTIISALQCLGKAFCFMDLVTLLMSDKALMQLNALLSEEPYRSDTRSAAFALWIEQYKQTWTEDGEVVHKLNANNLKKNLGGLGGELFRFATGNFGDVMNSYDPEINLYEDILANKIIYVALPTMGKAEAASSLGKMFVGDFRSAIAKIQALPECDRPGWEGSAQVPPKHPYFAFFDEVGSYAVENMDKIFEQGRSAGLACFPASQTLANLEKVSQEFKSQVTGNTWTKIFFKVGVQETATQIADLIGMTRRGVRNEAQSVSQSEGAQSLQANPQSQASRAQNEQNTLRETEECLVSPDQLKNLDRGECVVFYGGNETYHLKVPYIKVTDKGYEKVGKMQINHKKIRKVNGIHLHEKMVKLINKELAENISAKTQKAKK